MANNFTAEANNTAGAIFATRQIDGSSVHYPVGLLAWGSSANEAITSTSAPFPTQLIGSGLSSSAPFFVTNNSAHFLWAKPVTDTANPVVVRGVGSSVVPVSGTVTLNALSTASKIQVEPVTSSARRTFVDNSSAHPMFVRGLGDSTLPVSGTVAVTNAGLTALSSAFTSSDELQVTGSVSLSTASKVQVEPVTSSANRTFVDNNSAHPVFVRGLTSSAVDVTGTVTVGAVTAGAGMGLNGLSSAAGGLLSQTLTLSSLAQTVITAAGRLYGWSVSNPSTAANAWFLIYPDDSGGVTLGTSSAQIWQMVPFGGGREASWPQGVFMSSGMSIAAAATAGSTVHDSPAATLTMTVYYTASS